MPTPEELILVNVRHLLPYSYMQAESNPQRLIRFNPRYYESVREGVKTATTRFDDPCQIGPVWLLFEFHDQYRTLPGFVETVESKRFDELNDEDAQREGGRVADDLKTGLRHHYPQIRSDDVVDVVRFRVQKVPQ